MASATAIPQPVATTIQPEFWPLDLLRTTFATTPSPKVTSSIVPISSAATLVMTFVRPGKLARVVIRSRPTLSMGFYQRAEKNEDKQWLDPFPERWKPKAGLENFSPIKRR